MCFYNSIMKLQKLGSKSKTKLRGILSCSHGPVKHFTVVVVHPILLIWSLDKCMIISWKTGQEATRKVSWESRAPECACRSFTAACKPRWGFWRTAISTLWWCSMAQPFPTMLNSIWGKTLKSQELWYRMWSPTCGFKNVTVACFFRKAYTH